MARLCPKLLSGRLPVSCSCINLRLLLIFLLASGIIILISSYFKTWNYLREAKTTKSTISDDVSHSKSYSRPHNEGKPWFDDDPAVPPSLPRVTGAVGQTQNGRGEPEVSVFGNDDDQSVETSMSGPASKKNIPGSRNPDPTLLPTPTVIQTKTLSSTRTSLTTSTSSTSTIPSKDTLHSKSPADGHPAVVVVPRAGSKRFPLLYKKRKCNLKIHSKAACELMSGAITNEHYKVFMDCLSTFVEVAAKKGWTYFLSFGSLLGSWRHHGMIEWDGDMDVYVNITHRDDIIQTFKNTDYTPQLMMKPIKIVKLYSTLSNINVSYVKEGIGWWMWPYLDIFFFTENATHIFNVDNSNPATFRKKDVFPLHLRPFESLWVPSPRNPYQLLKRLYGEGSYLCKGYGTQVDCKELKTLVPFVHRQMANGSMIEILKLGNETLRQTLVKYEFNAVTDPYDFTKINHL